MTFTFRGKMGGFGMRVVAGLLLAAGWPLGGCGGSGRSEGGIGGVNGGASAGQDAAAETRGGEGGTSDTATGGIGGIASGKGGTFTDGTTTVGGPAGNGGTSAPATDRTAAASGAAGAAGMATAGAAGMPAAGAAGNATSGAAGHGADVGPGGAAGVGGWGGSDAAGAGGETSRLRAVFEDGPDLLVARLLETPLKLDDGRALLVGGHGHDFVSLDSAELWNPVEGSSALVPMQGPHDTTTAQRLETGEYLVVGGGADLGGAPGYATAEIFDPATLTFSSTGDMVRPHMLCDAAILPGGRVLVLGGWYDEDSATYGDVYDPDAGTFSATLALNAPRSQPLLLPTADGRVAVLGGRDLYGTTAIDQVELYDPDSGSFTVLRPDLIAGEPGWHVAWTPYRPDETQRLSDGTYVLGASNDSAQYSLVLFDPSTLEARRVQGAALSSALILDPAEDVVYGLYALSAGQLSLARVDMLTETVDILPVEGFTVPYDLYHVGMVFADSTRIWLFGGTTCTGTLSHFCPVAHTFFIRLVSE